MVSLTKLEWVEHIVNHD